MFEEFEEFEGFQKFQKFQKIDEIEEIDEIDEIEEINEIEACLPEPGLHYPAVHCTLWRSVKWCLSMVVAV